MAKIRIGLLSFAHFHQRHWVRVFQQDPRVLVAGLWDADPARREAASKEFGLPAFGRAEDLLDECSAAAICSETRDHPRLLGLCRDRGVHVFCEKPAGIDLETSRKMKELIKGSSLRYYQSFPQRHIPSNKKIKELLDAGAIGRVTHVRKRHGHYFGLFGLREQMPWIADPLEAGGGAFLDEGIHETDVLRWFFGDPVSVSADFSRSPGYPVETSGAAVYRFPGELLVVLEGGWNWHAGGPTTEIYGDKGVIVQNLTDCASNSGGGLSPHLSLYESDKKAWRDLGMSWDFGTIHTLAPKDFVDVLEGKSEPASDIDDAIRAAELIEGAYRSFKEGRRVDFPLV